MCAIVVGMGAIDRMLCFALYSASRKTTRTYREWLEPWNLTYPQYLVLYVLWNQGPRTIRELGEEMQLDSGTLSPLVKRLEQAGYVSRHRALEDERVVNIELTDAGEGLREPLSGVPRDVAAAMGVPDDDTAGRLIRSLRQLGRQEPAPSTHLPERTDMTPIYTAEALAAGDGRDGHVATSDGRLDLDLAVPTEMGGSGDGANPELLFAAGYAACFHSALQIVARTKKVSVADSSVGIRVGIGSDGNGGFELSVHLEVTIPGMPPQEAQALADAAHQVCPYSNATRGNIEVTVSVVDD
jgi:Ohr subfamily peroxiredoxin